MPKLDRSGARRVVYFDAGLHSLVSVLARRIQGHQISYLRARSPREERLLQALGARKMDIAAFKNFDVGPRSTEGPIERAFPRLQRPDVDAVINYVAQRHQTRHARAILKSAVIGALARNNLDAFYVEAWARNNGDPNTSIVVASHWQRLLLEGDEHPVGGWGDVVLGAVVDGGRFIFRKLASVLSQRRTMDSLEAHGNRVGRSTWRPNSQAQGPVLLVLNKGLTYGGLYSYDYILDDNPVSVLSMDHVVAMAATGGASNSEGIVWGYPRLGSTIVRVVARLRLFLACVWRVGVVSIPTAWLLAGVSVRAEARARSLAEDLPAVRVAVLAYDLQVPVDLVLAFESAGVRTVAVNERPQSLVLKSQPLAADTLLTASPWFSEQALQSQSTAVRQAIAVGMWRTDSILWHASAEQHPIVARTRSEHRAMILALPYHVNDHTSGNLLATSTPSVRHFLADILDIAEQRPEVTVVIRGKNGAWREHHAFSDLAQRSRQLPNVVVSTNYARLNEAYRLVAGADLVVAKYTSLVDEALAMGIPCVVHDYTPNSHGISRPLVPYLPNEVWAEDRDELWTRVDAALSDKGHEFKSRWEQERLRYFGDFSDGFVIERSRREILKIVEETKSRRV